MQQRAYISDGKSIYAVTSAGQFLVASAASSRMAEMLTDDLCLARETRMLQNQQRVNVICNLLNTD